MSEHGRFQASKATLSRALSSGTFNHARRLFNDMPAAEAAHLLESSTPHEREVLWNLVDKEKEGDILHNLSEEVRSNFLKRMSVQEMAQVMEEMDIDDLADMLQELPEAITRRVLANLDEQNRQRAEKALQYPEDTAGGLMDTDVITVRPDITLDVVLRYLKRHNEIPAMTDALIVVNRKDIFVGLLPLTTLLTSDNHITVREAMQTDVEAIPASTQDNEVAQLFERLDLITAPVVDKDGKLLGRITIDDVVDVIIEEADHSIMTMAGLDSEEDTFAAVIPTWRRRGIWLGVNLLTALLASAVIGMFSDTIEKVVALAILMPIVASMGGIAGSQTLTLVIRSMALGHINSDNTSYLFRREFAVGVLNGLFWAGVVGAAAWLWFSDSLLGFTIALALIINLCAAAAAGALLPVIMKSMKIDPALAGGVVLTTVTDVIGFLSFLGLATALYA